MEKLKCFDSDLAIELLADLEILNNENIKINFKWRDSGNEILFSAVPENGRHHELWKQTCFEVFLRLKNQKRYFEINLSTTKAWNIYEFQNYRDPQPPVEYKNVKKVEINLLENELTANILLSHIDLSQIEVALCAVLLLKDGRTTYWSTVHADVKPNFHHADSFTIERKIR